MAGRKKQKIPCAFVLSGNENAPKIKNMNKTKKQQSEAKAATTKLIAHFTNVQTELTAFLENEEKLPNSIRPAVYRFTAQLHRTIEKLEDQV